MVVCFSQTATSTEGGGELSGGSTEERARRETATASPGIDLFSLIHVCIVLLYIHLSVFWGPICSSLNPAFLHLFLTDRSTSPSARQSAVRRLVSSSLLRRSHPLCPRDQLRKPLPPCHSQSLSLNQNRNGSLRHPLCPRDHLRKPLPPCHSQSLSLNQNRNGSLNQNRNGSLSLSQCMNRNQCMSRNQSLSQCMNRNQCMSKNQSNNSMNQSQKVEQCLVISNTVTLCFLLPQNLCMKKLHQVNI